MRTAGPPAALRLTVDRDTITTDPGDVAHVAFEIVDSAGTVIPAAGNLVTVKVTGGSLVVLDNADMRDLEPYRSGSRRAFNGRGMAIVRAAEPGALTLTAGADGLRAASLTVHAIRGHPPAAIPAAR